MIYNNFQTVSIILVGLICLTGTVSAQSSENYDLSWDVIGSGGGEMHSTNYAVQSTIGQTAIGTAGDGYQLEAGYWYSILSEPGNCGDVDENGIVNIVDVRLLMNQVADPGGYPVDIKVADVNGDGYVDGNDVDLLVMHVFNPYAHPLNCN